MNNLYNLNIISEKLIISPNDLKIKYPLDYKLKNNIDISRNIISNIINKKDKRFLIICGPCSIHDYNLTIEYANKLKEISNKVKKSIYLVMRVYLEKPRTSIGWKGLINDPYIDESYNIEYGIELSRKLLIKIANINIPIATELLNPIISKYTYDLLSWISIGARTSESQIHREIVSSLPIPVGFKNSTDGTVESSINSVKSSSKSQNFITINNDGKLCFIKTKGNKNCHIILRGGKNKPNYFSKDINNYTNLLNNNNINTSIIVDCSHDNSYKNYKLQHNVVKNVINQRINNEYITGIMIESNINEGSQLCLSLNKLKYGISITDSCISWKDTEKIIMEIHNQLIKKI